MLFGSLMGLVGCVRWPPRWRGRVWWSLPGCLTTTCTWWRGSCPWRTSSTWSGGWCCKHFQSPEVVANCQRTFFQFSFQHSQGRTAAGDVCDWDRGLRCPGALTTRLWPSLPGSSTNLAPGWGPALQGGDGECAHPNWGDLFFTMLHIYKKYW